MASYLGYAERQADSFVNWAEVGKNMSDMLREESRIREDKKAALDKATREFGETLANAPQGDHKSMNQWALEYGSDATEAMLMQERLLKSGRLRLKDYTIMRQNIQDGTKQAFNLVKEYQQEYKTKMDRYKEQKSQDLETWIMAQAEGLGNFNQTKLYINPTDFTVSVAKTERKMVNGKEVVVMSKDPNSYTTVNALRNRIKDTFDRYDVQSNIKNVVDSFGVEINSIERLGTLYKTGSITETLDITKRKNLPKDAQGIIMKFEEAETKILETQLVNEYNVSSILTNSVKNASNGKQYTFTWDKAERDRNPELILLKNSPSGKVTPEFTEEQYNAALERLRLEARMQYDKKAEVRATPQAQLQERRPKTEGEMKREDEKQMADNFGRNLALLISGNAQQKTQARDYFKSIPGMDGINVTADGIVVQDRNGALTFSYTPEGRQTTSRDMAGAIVKALNKEGLDENLIMQAFERFKPSDAVSKFDIGFAGRETVSYRPEFEEYAAKNVKSSYVEDDPEETASALNEKFKKLGFTFEGDSRGLGNDFIRITPKGGQPSEWISIDDDASGVIESFIINNMDEKATEESGLFAKKTVTPTGQAAAPAPAPKTGRAPR